MHLPRKMIAALLAVATASALLLIGSATQASAVTTQGPYFLKNLGSGKCLEVSGSSTANIQLDQWTCENATNEKWYVDWVEPAAFRLRNAATGKCANFSGASKSSGTKVIQYPCGAYANEYLYSTVTFHDYNDVYGARLGYGSLADVLRWNGYGWVPDTSNGAKIVENQPIGFGAQESWQWCTNYTCA